MGINTKSSDTLDVFFVQEILKINDITCSDLSCILNIILGNVYSPVVLSYTAFSCLVAQSHMLGPLPSFFAAPSTWYAAVATPNLKPLGYFKSGKILFGA